MLCYYFVSDLFNLSDLGGPYQEFRTPASIVIQVSEVHNPSHHPSRMWRGDKLKGLIHKYKAVNIPGFPSWYKSCQYLSVHMPTHRHCTPQMLLVESLSPSPGKPAKSIQKHFDYYKCCLINIDNLKLHDEQMVINNIKYISEILGLSRANFI